MYRRYLAYFGIVFVALGLAVSTINYALDPFSIRPGARPDVGQEAVARRADYRLYRLSHYRNDPRPDIILGDSRTAGLPDSLFAAHGVRFANLSFAGGTAFEAIDAFWFANERIPLGTVVLGLPFNLYSETNDLNLVPAALDRLRHPLWYYLAYSTLSINVRGLLSVVTGRRFDSEAPPMTSEEFWRFQLGEGTVPQYGAWQSPQRLKERLLELVRHCKRQGIRLVILIPPTHTDLQRRVQDFGLESAYVAYKTELKSWGVTVLDYDVPNTFTSDRTNFSDPYHLTPGAKRVLVDAMFADGLMR